MISSVEPGELDWTLEALSVALGSIGEMDRAEITAQSISHPYVQGSALEKLTGLAAEGGDLDKAESIARSITDLRAQGNALTRFARVLCDKGDVVKARCILAESLIKGDPFAAVSVIAAIDSRVIDITVQYVTKRNPSRGE